MPHHKSSGILSEWCLIWDFILTEGSTEKPPVPSGSSFLPTSLFFTSFFRIIKSVSHLWIRFILVSIPIQCVLMSPLWHFWSNRKSLPSCSPPQHSRILSWPFHRMPTSFPTLSAFHSLHPQVLASRSSGAITGNIIPHRALHTVSSDQESSFSYNVSDSVSNREG